MHQAILTRALRNADTIAARPLRFIRSSSSSLPPQVYDRARGGVQMPGPGILRHDRGEHQMTSTRCPPKARKSGSVGVAAGPEVAIMADSGR